jgi:tetratricopeptide (TPR) repeat protein
MFIPQVFLHRGLAKWGCPSHFVCPVPGESRRLSTNPIQIRSMPEITEAELAPNVKALWLKSLSAVQMNNHGYAVKILQSVLKDAPDFLEGRQVLRKCEAVVTGGPKKASTIFGVKSGSGLSLSKPTTLIKKGDPQTAIPLIEEELEKDPYNTEANDLLFEAFTALGLHASAVFALETIRKGHPEDQKRMHRLAEYYLARENPAAAADVYRDIIKHHPTDSAAIKGDKDSTARASMQKGNWSEQADMKSLLANKNQAEDLEKQARTGLTREQLEERRDKLVLKYSEDQNNLAVVKDLAGIYEQLEDWGSATSFYSWGYTLSNGDVALRTKAGHMQDRYLEQEMKDLEAAVKLNPDDAELKARLKERQMIRIAETVEEAKKRVEQNPTDPVVRYELGRALFDAEDYSAAIPHLQQAKRNPHIQSKVLLLLAKTFKAKGMYDMAAKQLADAVADLHGMDTTKKEILYEKGQIHDLMGDKAAALECFKEIYEVDYGYLDVAQRVESSYTA